MPLGSFQFGRLGNQKDEDERLRKMFPALYGRGLLPPPDVSGRGRTLRNLTAPGTYYKSAASNYPAAYGLAMQDQFSWLTGGRKLSGDELNRFMPPVQGGRDARFGTIGGFGQQAKPIQDWRKAWRKPSYILPGTTTDQPGGGYGANILMGKGPTGGMAAGGGGDLGDGPQAQEAPVPGWAMRDVETLKQLPYDLLDQYKRIADEGIFGIAGMNTIYQRGIRPAMDRYKQLIPKTLTSIRQTEGFLRSRAATALAKSLGGQFASQPGLAAKLIGDQVLAPSLARQAEMSMDLQTMTASKLAALDLAVGDLLKENMQSKTMGLAGIQDVMGFLQGRVADRWWDLSMRNKFGWTPEEVAAAKGDVQQQLMRLANELGIDMMELEYKFREWLMERQYELEEYGIGGREGEGESEYEKMMDKLRRG